MKNSFFIFKKSFIKLLLKNNLYILFLPDVVICYYILYNMILDGEEFDIETLMAQLSQPHFGQVWA